VSAPDSVTSAIGDSNFPERDFGTASFKWLARRTVPDRFRVACDPPGTSRKKSTRSAGYATELPLLPLPI
jgi:hypothetical protein